jgi:hypothetical protein
MLPCTYIGTY